jgi:hypothetical protein
MWCPPDYVHISEIIHDCYDAAYDVLPVVRSDEFRFVEGEGKRKYDFENSNSERRLAVMSKLYELFYLKHGAAGHACAPDGRLLRLAREVLRPVIYNHSMEYSSLFQRRPKLTYIDLHFGTIDPAGIKKRVSYVDFYDPDDWEQEIELLGPFAGWSVCFPHAEISHGKAAMVELWTQWQRQPDPSVGRPRERDKVAAAYKKHFPDGHAGFTRKEVLRVLEEREDLVVSVDTLKRALGLRE